MVLKVWGLKNLFHIHHTAKLNFTPSNLPVIASIVAHDNTIDCASIAPDESMVATGSRDKTARLWSLPTLSPSQVLRGHKKGVHSVEFSALDKIIATSSGDR